MVTLTGQNRMSFAVSNGLWPGAPTDPHLLPGGVGPRGIALTFDFTATTGSNGQPIAGDLTIDESTGDLGSVQAIWIDNRLNPANNFTIAFPTLGQVISLPKNTQAIMPVIETTPLRFVASTAGLVTVPVIFLNMPLAPLGPWAAS